MRTPLALLVIAAVALGPAAAASAKEISAVKVCGADGCHDVTDRATMAVADGGPPTTWPDEPSPFYRVKISVKGEDGETVPGWTFLWVPAVQKVEFEDGTWGNPASTTIDELTKLTRSIEPLPASRLTLPAPVQAEVVAPPPAQAPPAADGGPADHGLGGPRGRRARARGPAGARRGVRARPPRGLRRRRVRLHLRPGGRGIGAVTIEATDADLAARARTGDDTAFGMLVERHQTVAFRTAYVICGDAADAEDAAQDGFIKARAAMGRFRAGAPFRPWLLTIVANEARNRRRAAGRRSALALRAAAEPVAPVPAPEAAALAGSDRRELAAALARLGPEHREVIALRFLLDLSEAECAAALGCRPGTVKSRLSRALARLRVELEGSGA